MARKRRQKVKESEVTGTKYLRKLLPVRVDVTRKAGGEADERAVLKRCIEPDRTYVLDRGHAMFSLFNQIVAAKSSYVCRIRDNSGIEGIESRELTEHDLAAGVLRDQIVSIGKSCAGENRPNHPVRVVEVQTTPHVKRGKHRGGSTGPGSDGILRIATNLLDAPAETIAVLYEHRWTIEIQTHCAIIACMLISLWTGRKPSTSATASGLVTSRRARQGSNGSLRQAEACPTCRQGPCRTVLSLSW